MLDRRKLLAGAAKLTLLAPLSSLAHAVPKPDARFVLVILRGGLDGLAAVPPYGERRYRELRGALALPAPGAPQGALALGGLFGLHPALKSMHALYGAGELSVLHAVATPYRERSHFDAQKVLEAGGTRPSTSAGGWLNRALLALRAAGAERQGIALSSSVPLVMRGPFAVTSFAPSHLPDADEDTLARIRELYEATDPMLAARLVDALNARELAEGAAGERDTVRRGGGQAVTPLVTAAARFLAAEDGPRIAVIDVGGWDTHANQGGANGQLANRLRGLDTGLDTFKRELGPHWRHTSVLVVTEFGRTVAVNGTRGTDHGTGAAAFLAGGAVAGGRVIADWPGLAARDLHEGRDLRATLDLRAVLKGLLGAQFGIDRRALARDIFPDSGSVRPLDDLLA